jgi:hypothetical protein
VSKIGISSTRTGPPTIDSRPEPARLSGAFSSASVATLKPMNRLPLSPMKIDAGWKL